MPHYSLPRQQESSSVSPYASVGIGHPALGGPLHALPPQVYASGYGDGHAFVGDFSASMTRQLSAYYPYARFLDWVKACGGFLNGCFGRLDGVRVTVIGGGPIGQVAAIMLDRAGALVTLIEAKMNLHGRTLTRRTRKGCSYPFGMMRYSESNSLLMTWLLELGLGLMPGFPNPGKCNNTLVSVEGETVEWFKGQDAPEGFENVAEWFAEFLANGYDDLYGWIAIRRWLIEGNSEAARVAFQGWIDRFGNKSIKQVVQEVFADVWSEDDYKRFGALGVGSGGFGVLEEHSILDLLLVLVEGHEEEQCGLGKVENGQLVPAAPDDFIVALGKRLEKSNVDVRLNSPISKVEHDDGDLYTITAKGGDQYAADVVLTAVTIPALFKIENLLGLLGDPFPNGLPSQMRSSKQFFVADVSEIEGVNDPQFPRCLLSDEKSPQIYMLPGSEPHLRVVLLLYGWQTVHDGLERMSVLERQRVCIDSGRRIVAGTRHEEAWGKVFDNADEAEFYDWQKDEYAGSAFTFAGPGDVKALHEFAYGWEGTEGDEPPKVYAVNSDGKAGGWINDALQSALLNVSKLFKDHGRLNFPDLAPCNQTSSKRLNFH